MGRGCLYLTMICFGMTLAVVEGCRRLAREGMRAAQTSAFTPHIQEYLRQPQRLPAGQPRPVARGGFLPVNLSREVVDGLYLALPEEMRAGSPEEVSTVVWVRRGARTLGMNRRGVQKYQNICRVTVIDYPCGMLLAETVFEGSLPRGRMTVGSEPSDQNIVAYLYTLMFPPRAAPRPPEAPAPRPGPGGAGRVAVRAPHRRSCLLPERCCSPCA